MEKENCFGPFFPPPPPFFAFPLLVPLLLKIGPNYEEEAPELTMNLISRRNYRKRRVERRCGAFEFGERNRLQSREFFSRVLFLFDLFLVCFLIPPPHFYFSVRNSMLTTGMFFIFSTSPFSCDLTDFSARSNWLWFKPMACFKREQRTFIEQHIL